MVMYQSNYIGESEASQIINTNTVGDKPLPPRQDSFIIVNSTLAILRLDKWQQMSCPILYFVIEYKLRSESPWTVGKFHQQIFRRLQQQNQKSFPLNQLRLNG